MSIPKRTGPLGAPMADAAGLARAHHRAVVLSAASACSRHAVRPA